MSRESEAKRRGLIKSFKVRKGTFLEDLQEDFGGVVQDIRLHGSVLNPAKYGKDSDVDAAIIVAEDEPKWVARLHKALYGGGYSLCLRYGNERVQVDAITMLEAEWPAWQRGKSKEQRGMV